MTNARTMRAVARDYRRGATTRQLAAEYGVHESTIRAWLRAAGVPTRRTGPRDHPVSDDTIREMMEAGASWQEIADETGMSRSGVRARCRRIQGLPHWR